MSWQTILTIAAACFGIASGIWLAVGTLTMKPEWIKLRADEKWKCAPEVASALISESANYLAGATLLGVSFALQVAAVQASAASLQWSYPVPINTWTVAVGSFLCTLPIFCLRAARKNWLESELRPLLQQQQ